MPVHPPAELVEPLRAEIGELPAARIRRIAETLSFYDADVLVTGGLDRLWSAVVDAGADPKETANVLANEFVATGIDPERVDAAELAKLVSARAEIPRAAFDEALAHVGDDGLQRRPVPRAEGRQRRRRARPGHRRGHRREPGQAEQYRGGKEGLLGFFVGQVMKETGGKADPRVVSERVREKLAG